MKHSVLSLISNEDFSVIQGNERIPVSKFKPNISGVLKIGVRRSPKIYEVNSQVEVDEEIGWLIGFWHAEGRTRENVVAINNSDIGLIELFLKYLEKLGDFETGSILYVFSKEKPGFSLGKLKTIHYPMEGYRYRKVHYRLEITSKVLYEILRNIFQTFQLDNSFARGYIAGIVDGDGHLNKNGSVDIEQVGKNSQTILDSLEKEFKMLGMKIHRTENRIILNRGRNYSNARNFVDLIPLKSEKNLKKLNFLSAP